MDFMDFTFGVEIECYKLAVRSTQEIADAISLAGCPCQTETYNHFTRPHWKLVSDGSLDDYTNGIEIVSPVLRGTAGLDAVVTVCRTLEALGCAVTRNNRCGLHVHVGVGASPSMDFFKRLFKFYAKYEPIIDAFMPKSRRASNNNYCRTITNVDFDRVDRATSLTGITDLTCDPQIQGSGPTSRNDVRYHKLNLAAYRKHQTVEYRQHSGTLDGLKARYWTMFCLRMTAFAASALPMPVASAAPMNAARQSSKIHIVGDLLLRPEGCTQAEALAATGWQKISMVYAARACGLTITSERTGRITRYYAVHAPHDTRPATLDTLMDLLQCSPAEAQYFRERTARFARQLARE